MGKRRQNAGIHAVLPAAKLPSLPSLAATITVAFSLSIVVFLAYGNAIQGTWAMDDVLSGKAVGIQDLSDLIGLRKAAYATFLLNERIAAFTPANFRLFNIALHICNSILVFLLAYRTLRLARSDQPESRSGVLYAAAAAGGFFALHPININAVAYIIQRMASLAAFFVLLSVLCYSFAALAKGKKVVLLAAATMVFLVGGMASKENAILALPLLILYDAIFLQRVNPSRERLLITAGLGIAVSIVAVAIVGVPQAAKDVMESLAHPGRPIPASSWTAVDVYWTPLAHVLTGFRVVCRYLFLILVPLPSMFVFDWWSFPVSGSLVAPVTTLISAFFLLAASVVAIRSVRKYPFLAFGILWYLIAISLESFLVVGLDLYFEHRNYLPMAGLSIGIAGQVLAAAGNARKQRVVFVCAAIVCIGLAASTFVRNRVWKDSVTLWTDTLKKHPDNIRAKMSLGNAWLAVSDLEKAEAFYEAAIQQGIQDKRLNYLDGAVYRLGMAYLMANKKDDAKKLIATAEKSLDSTHLRILKTYSQATEGNAAEAIPSYRRLLREVSGNDTVLVQTLLGDAFRIRGEWQAAQREYLAAIELDRGYAPALYGMGVSCLASREIERAQEYFRKTLSVDPENVLALTDMAELLLLKDRDVNAAHAYARRAVGKGPFMYQPYLVMGNILTVKGEEREADDFYNQALKHRMPKYLVPFSKARSYYLRGEKEKALSQIATLRAYPDLPDNIRAMLRQ